MAVDIHLQQLAKVQGEGPILQWIGMKIYFLKKTSISGLTLVCINSGNKGLIPISHHVYNVTHDDEAMKYWSSKQVVAADSLAVVHWDAIGASMTESTRGCRVFISKPVVGMWSVRKFMKRWSQRDNDLCPHCGLFEDAAHIQICREQGADDVWNRSIDFLRQWLNSVQTDSNLIHIVVQVSQRAKYWSCTHSKEDNYYYSNLLQMGKMPFW